MTQVRCIASRYRWVSIALGSENRILRKMGYKAGSARFPPAAFAPRPTKRCVIALSTLETGADGGCEPEPATLNVALAETDSAASGWVRCLSQRRTAKSFAALNMAGVVGLEPTNAGIKTQCLATWRHPNNLQLICSVLCSGDRCTARATNPLNDAGRWAKTASALTLSAKLAKMQAPVPVSLAEAN